MANDLTAMVVVATVSAQDAEGPVMHARADEARMKAADTCEDRREYQEASHKHRMGTVHQHPRIVAAICLACVQ